ncbi:MAG: UDP-N-acetylmuramoyl-L-alanyl-D-glutamate--2,6-diaminopimelate ligase [Betaproteobacteria bacterium]|nr:UDP-N-acetylmuramoyl-L-alanyl-D-glutamate--2,6-diaminopimelate ligase [Betaproteobacteria bacterium]
MANPINELLDWFRAKELAVSALAVDSRRVNPGDVFLAYPGEVGDGRLYIGEALQRGAAAVLWDAEDFNWSGEIDFPQRPVAQLRQAAGALAHQVYGRPSESLWTMGVTGTNGKTSCSHWLAQACELAGAHTAVIGTLGMGFPGEPGGDATQVLLSNPNTTPDPVSLHSTLAALLREGGQGVAMEVSSIGLDQGRVNGVAFGAALFTNLSHDHLDYHGDMETYARAKQRLFLTPGLRHAVLNLDDVQSVQIARMLSGSGVNRIGYSCVEGVAAHAGLECFVQAHAIRISSHGCEFTVTTSWGEAKIRSSLLGRFNVANLAGVLGTMLGSGVPFDRAIHALAQMQPVVGRMQRLGGNERPLVVVDYAHSPDGLEQTLALLKEIARAQGGKLAAVFGCGGERDRGKRALMGTVAARHADRIVLTNDNPRGEDPEVIIAEIAAGIDGACERLPDRREAILRAVRESGARDIVLLAGKGHEAYQEIGGRRVAFSDVLEARQALEAWGA